MTSKKLRVPQLNIPEPTLEKVSAILDNECSKAEIATINWETFPYLPKVKFAMGYDMNHLYLKYYVREEHIRALETKNNGNVWEDSCCEFFCAFDESGYYNMETNCIGTQLIGWGKRNEKRIRLSDKVINAVEKKSTLEQKIIQPQSGTFEYQLTMVTPVSTFTAHRGLKFTPGMQFTGNFYKCGDKTPEPHFVSWSPISIEKPDFHRPDYFGTIELV